MSTDSNGGTKSFSERLSDLAAPVERAIAATQDREALDSLDQLRDLLVDNEDSFRAIRKALSRGDWTDVQRMGTARRIAQEALDGF